LVVIFHQLEEVQLGLDGFVHGTLTLAELLAQVLHVIGGEEGLDFARTLCISSD